MIESSCIEKSFDCISIIVLQLLFNQLYVYPQKMMDNNR